jgi:hypothetical protein
MLDLVSLSILLTVVYSWEDLKHLARRVARILARSREPIKIVVSNLDKLVGTLVMLGTFPATLLFFVSSGKTFFANLIYAAAGLLLVSVVAAGVSAVLKRAPLAMEYGGAAGLIPIGFSAVTLFFPTFRMASNLSLLPRRTLAQFSFLLSLPLLLGFVLGKVAGVASAGEEYLPNIQILILVLIAALFMRISSNFLGKHFRLYQLNGWFSYFRIALGIVLGTILLLGFWP